MVVLVKLLLMLTFAALSIAAVFVLILAVSTVGLGGFLPFTSVSKEVFAKAAPHRKRLLWLIIAAVVVCALLAIMEIVFPNDSSPAVDDPVVACLASERN